MRSWFTRISCAFFVLAELSLPACGGGGGAPSNGGAAIPTPVPTPVPTASQLPIVTTPASLSFLGTGTALQQPLTVSQPSYTGAFSESAPSCGKIAVITQVATNAFNVVPSAAGQCTALITNASGWSTSVSISVTTTTVGGS